jgi:serine protease Do
MAMHVAKSLIAHGKVERGWIGVTVQDIEQETANTLGIKSRKGALVVEVIRGGPAEKAGIKKNDIVLFYDGREIEDSEDLRNRVASTNPGSSVKVRILRNGKEEEVTLKVLSTDGALKLLERLVKERLGAELRQVDEKDAERYGLQDTRALIIISTEPKGPFAQAGLEAKDLILAYDGQAVSDLEGFVQYVASLPLAKRVTLLALDHRTGNMGYVDVTLR